MKIYYRKMKRVSRESEEDRLKPTGPWRLTLGGSPLSAGKIIVNYCWKNSIIKDRGGDEDDDV